MPSHAPGEGMPSHAESLGGKLPLMGVMTCHTWCTKPDFGCECTCVHGQACFGHVYVCVCECECMCLCLYFITDESLSYLDFRTQLHGSLSRYSTAPWVCGHLALPGKHPAAFAHALHR